MANKKEYIPSDSPRQFDEAFLDWVKREFQAVRDGMSQLTAADLNMPSIAEAPGKLIDGMVRYADGTVWNPGNGKGVYVYINGGWQLLQGTGGTGTGGITDAPSDGTLYGRKDAAWQAVQSGGGGGVAAGYLSSYSIGNIGTNDTYQYLPFSVTPSDHFDATWGPTTNNQLSYWVLNLVLTATGTFSGDLIVSLKRGTTLIAEVPMKVPTSSTKFVVPWHFQEYLQQGSHTFLLRTSSGTWSNVTVDTGHLLLGVPG